MRKWKFEGAQLEGFNWAQNFKNNIVYTSEEIMKMYGPEYLDVEAFESEVLDCWHDEHWDITHGYLYEL
jgi:hypothetical protein